MPLFSNAPPLAQNGWNETLLTKPRKTKHVTKSHFARMCGVSPSAVTKACRGKLKPALHRDRVDVEHAAAVAYLASHKKGNGAADARTVNGDGGGPQPPAPDKNGRRVDGVSPVVVHNEDNLGAYADMTIRDIVNQFGTERVFKDWLEAHSKIEDVEQKRIRNQEYRGELVRRDLVRRTVFSAWEDSNRRLLGDVPRTLVARLYAAALSEVSKEESERVVKEIISGVLRNVKETAERALEPKP